MITRYDNDGNLVAWVRPLNSDAMAELESAHCYAAEFGTVLEWCTERTDMLFAPGPDLALASMPRWSHQSDAESFGTAMARAAVAYTQLRDARRVERMLGGEAA